MSERASERDLFSRLSAPRAREFFFPLPLLDGARKREKEKYATVNFSYLSNLTNSKTWWHERVKL